MITDISKENKLREAVIGAAIEVHQELGGPGMLERVYEEALMYELKERGICYTNQLSIPVNYKTKTLANPVYLDLLIEKSLIVEVKAVSEMAAIFQAQVLTYLRLCNLKVGLVINFGLPRLIDGVNRVINNKYKP